MELKKMWFPLLAAAVWVVLCAMTLSGFASFSGTARAQRETPVQEHSASHAEGRRMPGSLLPRG
jgi:hypothetical protein